MARNSVSHFPRREPSLQKNKYTQPHKTELLKIPERIWITDMNKIKVLLIEDDRSISNFITATMDREGYKIMHALNGREGLSLSTSFCPNVILLDLGLPDMDGLEVLQKLRSWSDVPVIIISARTKEQEKVSALDLGADDYIEKPVDPQILAAKIRAVLQRTSDLHRKETISCCGVVIERAQHRAFVDGNLMELNAKEFELLTLLVSNAGKTLRKEYIFASIWGMDSFSEQQTLTVHIKMLRDKIEKNPKQPQRIKTVWGVGYRFEEV